MKTTRREKDSRDGVRIPSVVIRQDKCLEAQHRASNKYDESVEEDDVVDVDCKRYGDEDNNNNNNKKNNNNKEADEKSVETHGESTGEQLALRR